MRKILFLFVFAMVSYTSYGQFGVKAGLNLSGLTSDSDYENLESRANFLVGALYQINLTDNFAIRPEAVYIRKGASYDILTTNVNFKSDYVEFPVMAVIGLGELPINIQVGPQFSYLLSTSYGGDDLTFTAEEDDFEDYDLGLAAGVGIKINSFLIDVRYTRGLQNIEKETTIGGLTIEPSTKHFGLQAAVGVTF